MLAFTGQACPVYSGQVAAIFKALRLYGDMATKSSLEYGLVLAAG